MNKEYLVKVKQFEKVLEVIQNASPEAVSKDVLREELKDSGVEFYRLPTYIWEIKHKANVELETVKDGRKVTAYRLSVKTLTESDTNKGPAMDADVGGSSPCAEEEPLAASAN